MFKFLAMAQEKQSRWFIFRRALNHKDASRLKDIAELLLSAKRDIIVNKNFVAATEAISVALDEIATLETESQ